MAEQRFIVSRRGVSRALVAYLAIASQARAAELHVPGDFPTIQAAINAAVNGDEVIVAAGTYDESITFQSKAITVRSTDPIDGATVMSTIIRGGGGVGVVSSLVNGSVLDGLTITLAPGLSGTGVFVAAASPTIRNCIFFRLNNSGVQLGIGQPTFSRCMIVGCSSGGGGGGVFVGNASMATFENCVFRENRSETSGGGVEIVNNASPTFTNCNFEGNSAGTCMQTVGAGGAVTASGGATFNGCTFRLNRAIGFDGGPSPGGSSAFHISGGASVSIANSLFCENEPNEIIGAYSDLGGNAFSIACPAPGACCVDGACITTYEAACLAAGGVFQGVLSECADARCPAPACESDIAPPGGDDAVNVSDLLKIINDWGVCP